ncbi:hypothetical protein M9458_023234, partial [Cirrhinus mrigala]
SASVILETDSVELSCENTEDLKMEMCYFNINGRETLTHWISDQYLVWRSEFICDNNLLLHCDEGTSSNTIC